MGEKKKVRDLSAGVHRVSVSPHEFKPLRFWDRWRTNGRCQACFCGRDVHPTGGPARPLRDTSPARLRYPTYRSASPPTVSEVG